MPAFHYVYILQSIPYPTHFYTGCTTDLPSRVAKHNEGGNPNTAAFRPWSIKTATAFSDPSRAAAFERYLKSSSGRSFAKKHL
jgi:putative endonuclease